MESEWLELQQLSHSSGILSLVWIEGRCGGAPEPALTEIPANGAYEDGDDEWRKNYIRKYMIYRSHTFTTQPTMFEDTSHLARADDPRKGNTKLVAENRILDVIHLIPG